MPAELTPQKAAEWMAEELVRAKVDDMKCRAKLLILDGKALIAKGETIDYEACILENDLYKFTRNHPDLFPEE
jgi:hypothetical protein